jgi:hypothetical protein
VDEVMARVAPRFARVEPGRRVRAFMLGLVAELPRANCWTIAEHAGDASPDGMQHLLADPVWDADAVREDLRGYVVEHLAARLPKPAWHAFLSVITATAAPPDPGSGLIPLTRNEIRLLTAATATIQQATHVLRWSSWPR